MWRANMVLLQACYFAGESSWLKEDKRRCAATRRLSDNGSCYTATETTSFAKDMGFISCFTPVRSPESNGMGEAFVKTFKRDYVYVHDRPDAKTVMVQLGQWFEDYNEYD